MPRIEPVPRFRNASGSVSALTWRPFVHRNATPRKAYSVPSVTTSAGTWPNVTRTPFSAPHAAPSSIPRTITTGIGRLWCDDSRSPAMNAASPSTEPTDRSTLRVMITSVWPAARMAKIAAFSARLRSESAATKRGSMIAVTSMSSANAATMPSSRTRKTQSVRRARLGAASAAAWRSCVPAGAASRRQLRPPPPTWPVAARMTRLLVGLGAGELAGQPALVHDEHAVGHAEHLGQLARDHQDRDARARRARSSAGGPRPSCRRRCRASARRR